MVKDIIVHFWHWLFQMVQLGNWFGNIVAGVVTFFLASLFWPRVRHAIRSFVEGHVKSIHDRLDAHHEALLSQAEGHHEEHMATLKAHHEALLAATRPPVKKATVKKVVAKQAPARRGLAKKETP